MYIHFPYRFEFCYGKYVHQYHDDSRLGRTTIVVGTWDLEKHVEWTKLKSSKSKIMRPDKTVRQFKLIHISGLTPNCLIIFLLILGQSCCVNGSTLLQQR